ncbi:MAG: trypsin-like peptidase domain-containing protein [Pseudomonadota bacterium]
MRRMIGNTLAALMLASVWPVAQAAVPVLEMPPVDVEAAVAADALKKGPQPYRFAVPIAVRITPADQGLWSRVDGMAVWQLALHSAQASSLNFGFKAYALPEGAKLTISALDGSQPQGPYGSAHNRQGQLWTPIVRSDTALITLQVPFALREAVRLELAAVNHGFRGFGAKADSVSAKSGSCNIDVACSDGNAWRDEIRSVARFTIGGALLCTGQLVNNTAANFTPYFLTANHCVTSGAEAPTTVFYWNYQTSRCGGPPDGSLDQTQSGALFRAGSFDAATVASDFTLLELLARPPAAFKVYYAGWDRRDLAPIGVTGIHHPNGDEKRISMDLNQTFIAAYGEQPDSPQSALTPTHILVQSWDRGVTEGGSSGSGIWNSERRLVGQLSGGSSSCDAPQAPDWYGRMFSNFSNVPAPLTSLATWLDPVGNTQVLDGLDPAKSGTPPATGGGVLPGAGSGDAPASGNAGSGGGGAFGFGVLMLAAFGRLRRLRLWGAEPARASARR